MRIIATAFLAWLSTMTALTAAPAGGWTWYNDPRALEYEGVLYWGYLRGTDGSVVVAKWDGSTVSETVIASEFEVDDHDNPSLLVRASDERLMAFYSKHATSGGMKYRVTTNPLPDISSWAAEQTLTPVVAGDHTYAMPVQLSGEAGNPIRIFYRTHVSGDPELHYNRSDDGGSTWGAYAVRLHELTYTKIATDGTRIHFAASDHPAYGQTSIYHFYLDTADGDFKTSDGSVITLAGVPAIQAADMTVVYDGTTTRGWVHDIALDAFGNPVIVFATFPGNDGSDHRYQYARWTGSTWDVHEIVAAGGTIAEEAVGGGDIEAFYSGGVALDQSNPSVVYASIESSGDWEMRRYATSDDGATWTHWVVSSGEGKHVRPVGVRDGVLTRALWMTGTYDSYVDYSVGTSELSGFTPTASGIEVGFNAPTFTVESDRSVFPSRFGIEVGFRDGVRFRSGARRQLMLTGAGIETPEMTTGGEVGQMVVVTADGFGFADGGSVPATTVESETTWGITPAVGTDAAYARQDHTHGTPAEPTVSSSRWEALLTEDGSEPLTTEDGLDWLYVEVTD